MNEQPVTISFVATSELKELLEQWSVEDDRTVSATLRQILSQEIQRRNSRLQHQTGKFKAISPTN